MFPKSTLCPCCSKAEYLECCGQYILYKGFPNTAEALMRSRFTAYAIGEFQYILDTYAPQKRTALTIEELAQDQKDTKWTSLQIISKPQDHKVEFKAYYLYKNDWFLMHEESSFVQLDNRWFYLDGTIYEDTGLLQPRRNDLCPCESGKKFKKCCLT